MIEELLALAAREVEQALGHLVSRHEIDSVRDCEFWVI
jgi:hypothetical protein